MSSLLLLSCASLPPQVSCCCLSWVIEYLKRVTVLPLHLQPGWVVELELDSNLSQGMHHVPKRQTATHYLNGVVWENLNYFPLLFHRLCPDKV